MNKVEVTLLVFLVMGWVFFGIQTTQVAYWRRRAGEWRRAYTAQLSKPRLVRYERKGR